MFVDGNLSDNDYPLQKYLLHDLGSCVNFSNRDDKQIPGGDDGNPELAISKQHCPRSKHMSWNECADCGVVWSSSGDRRLKMLRSPLMLFDYSLLIVFHE